MNQLIKPCIHFSQILKTISLYMFTLKTLDSAGVVNHQSNEEDLFEVFSVILHVHDPEVGE